MAVKYSFGKGESLQLLDIPPRPLSHWQYCCALTGMLLHAV